MRLLVCALVILAASFAAGCDDGSQQQETGYYDAYGNYYAY